MKVFIMFKGLPGCGKSTVAMDLMNMSPDSVAIVERDNIREELGFLGKPFNSKNEDLVTERQVADLNEIMSDGSADVISSDTNLNPKCFMLYRRLCNQYGYLLHIMDMTDVPIEECIRRDSLRTGPKRVGEKVIRDMARRYGIGEYACRTVPAVPVTDPISINYSKPTTIVVDLDGTIASLGKRSPYDESKVMLNDVRWAVVNAVKALYQYHAEFDSDTIITFLSGRSDVCYDDTLYWIMEKACFDSDAFKIQLFMRKAGDQRRDSIVKNELFDAHIRNKYNVVGVFDDRDQVIRESWLPKGLPVFNVGNGSIF